MLIVMLCSLHLLGLLLAWTTSRAPALPANLIVVGFTSLVAGLLLLMISRSLVSAVQVLYTRGDADLLLASPMPARRVAAVRATFIAVSVSLEVGFLIWPFANMFALWGRPAWLKAYLLVPTLGLVATSLGLVLALALFSIFGPRRTRVIGQVLSAVIAVGFTLALQLPNMLRGSPRRQGFGPATWQGAALAIDGPLFAPARLWLAGNAGPLVLLLVGGGLFALTVQRLGDRFMTAAIAATGTAVSQARRPGRSSLRFGGTRRGILIRKELRLIVRDPWLLTQILQQCVAVLPLGVVAWRESHRGAPLIWGLTIYLCGFLAAALSWITLVAEDAPEILATAPISRREIVRVKLEAALWPILPLALLPAVCLLRSYPWFGVCVSLCAVGSALSCASLNVSGQPPAKRQDFRSRQRAKPLRGLVELSIVVVWSLLCWALVWFGHSWAQSPT
jgi:ABC-2 type transport system permease protein